MKIARLGRPHWSLAVKLGLFVLAGTLVIFAPAFTYNFIISRRIVLKNVEESARQAGTATVNKIEAILESVQKVPHYMALSLEKRRIGGDELFEFIDDNVEANSEIFGSAVAYEPYSFDKTAYYYALYCYRQGNEIRRMWLGGDRYRFYTYDWYLIPKELDHPLWSEPYFDEGAGEILMSTYSAPFYEDTGTERRLAGVVTADISLDRLAEIISSVKTAKSGFAFLVSQNGVFVAHPNKKLTMRESLFSIAEASKDMDLRRIGREMIRGGRGFVPLESPTLQEDSWLYYQPLPSLGWSIGIVFAEDDLFEDLTDLNQRVLIIGIVGFVGLFIVIVLISTFMTRPIRALARTTTEIARGNLDVQLPTVRSHDEVGELSLSFDNMRVALKEYIANLTETTAAKERIESELKIARTIQMSFLPKKFPPFPDHVEFDIYAKLEPAREVGGDLYDFFLLEGDYLFFGIGDVSGKGVPAALFMAVTKTLMKGVAMQYKLDPSAVLEKVNNELCKENDAMMFVTVFCAVMDTQSGMVVFSNAGHNRPVVVRQGKEPEFLLLPEGTILGVVENAEYRLEQIQLNPGDLIVAYTDGVTEATTAEQELYENDRLLNVCRGLAGAPPKTAVETIMASVKEFAGGAPQSDDITILAVRYGPRDDASAAP